MVLSDEDVAVLRADLERLQREVGAIEAANRESEAKMERLRRERSLGRHILRRARWWSFN